MRKTTQHVLIFALLFFLVTWGIRTLLIFLGVPAHTSVLVSPEALQQIQLACGPANEVCRGLHTLLPAIGYFFSRLGSIGTYAIFVGVLYGLYLGWAAFTTGYLQVKATIRPWYIWGAFVGMVWLLFTLYITQSPPENMLSMRQIIGPDPQIYKGLTEDGLNALRSYTDTLSNRGCLQVIGTTPGQYEVYNLKHGCVQMFFITRVFSQILFLTGLVLLVIATGMAAIRRIGYRAPTFFRHAFSSVVVGITLWIVALWLLALLGILNTYIVWGLIGVTAVVTYKQLQQLVTLLWTEVFEIKESWYSLALFAAFLLLSLLALNFLTVIRPFPIGWDDLGSYLNQPRLLTSYGAMTPALAVFKWEYLTALGYILFGYDSTFGATTALIINWSAGLLAVGSIVLFGTKFVPKRVALLAALLYYCMPIVGHFSFADMKIDNAVFAFQALGLFFALDALTTKSASKQRIKYILCGIALALGFAVKPTTTMMIFGVLALMTGWHIGVLGFIGVACLAFVVFAMQRVLSFAEVLERIGSSLPPSIVMYGLLGLGVALIAVAAVRQKVQLKPLGIALGTFLVVCVVVTLPWLTLTNISQGNTVPKLVMTTKNTLSPQLGVKDLPPELAVDTSHPACTNTGGVEELDRYWGNHSGIGHYALLPWRSVMNTDIQGYYVTSYQYILLLPLLLLLPWFWKPKQKAFRYIMGVTLFIILQWIFIGNGVVWYGIGMFAGIVLGLAALTYESPKLVRPVLVVFMLMSLLTALSMRMWQYEMQRGMMDYPTGKANSRLMAERTIPHYDNVREQIERLRAENPDRPYVYRVGTFIPYFIPRNMEVFGVVDHQLDIFNCMSQEEDYALTLKRMQALGFNSIIFDTNTATIEKTPGTLHAKVDKFITFLNDRNLNIWAYVADTQAGIAYFILP